MRVLEELQTSTALDLRARFARHSLTDIIAPAFPTRTVQTFGLDSSAMRFASWNSSGSIIAPLRFGRQPRTPENDETYRDCRDCHENGETISRPLDSRETETIGENSRLMCNTGPTKGPSSAQRTSKNESQRKMDASAIPHAHFRPFPQRCFHSLAWRS
jgi:hypothetical protein